MGLPAPTAAETDKQTRLAITWLGHATVLIELDGHRIITDPVLRNRIGPLIRIGPRPQLLESVDCTLLSHLHADHADLPSLRTLSQSGPVLAPCPAHAWLGDHGVRRVRELAPGGEVSVGHVRISATVARHDPRRRPFGPRADPIGYVIRGSSSVYFAGDTDLFLDMAQLHGSVDVALLPVWGWGPSVGAGHLDPQSAAAAVALIAPAVAIPIHWGTFALPRPVKRLADPSRPARDFKALTEQYSPSTEVRVLNPGQRTVL
ncbi:MAG TPA: MBL fold metallo-hydrolase [Solirubrobacteraceae bacterium]|nr:MBL fold metallo-hydrolase [Solirubrobacteraceae bacterium]